MIYYGSKVDDLKELPKRQAKNGSAIYAYDNIELALMDIYKGNGSLDFFKDVDENGKGILVERRPGLLKRILNEKGYIYIINSDNFKHEKGVWPGYAVSYEEEKIESVIYIENIYEELMKAKEEGKINIYEYPERPDYLPIDNSDLIVKYFNMYEMGNEKALKQLLKIYPEFESRVNEKIDLLNQSKVVHELNTDTFNAKYTCKQKHVLSIRDKKMVGNFYYVYPSNGFNFPYLMFVPEIICENAKVILVNGTPGEVSGTLEEMINKTVDMNKDFSFPISKYISLNYNYPLMIPIIPRPMGYYSTFFGREVFENDLSRLEKLIKEGKCALDIEDVSKFNNLPSQLYSMTKHSINMLKCLSYSVSDKVISTGYSAGAKVANIFSVLYPDLVDMEISGGTAGLSIIPSKEINRQILNYPIGVNDVVNFDLDKFKEVKHFMFIGSDDFNDPAMCKCELEENAFDPNGNVVPKRNENGDLMPLLDVEGKLLPYYEGTYNKDNINALASLYCFSNAFNNQMRFDLNAKIYDKIGIDSVHKKYPGNHKTVFDNMPLIMEDIISFIDERLEKERLK